MSKLQSLKRKFLDEDEKINLKKLDDSEYSSKHGKKRDSEKKKKKKKDKKHKKKKSKKKHRSSSDSSSSSNESDEWVEKTIVEPPKVSNESNSNNVRDDWMSMTGMFSTYTKADLKASKNAGSKAKANIDDYKPGECSRELNPYWKNGGTGLPSENEGSSKKLNFLKPNLDETFTRNKYEDSKNRYKHEDYEDDSRNSYKDDDHKDDSRNRYKDDDHEEDSRNRYKYNDYEDDSRNRYKYKDHNDYRDRYKHNDYRDDSRKKWKKQNYSPERSQNEFAQDEFDESVPSSSSTKNEESEPGEYMTDEQMNVLGAKIVKAEIFKNKKLVEQLKQRLESARQYKRLNPRKSQNSRESVMLTVSDNLGRSKPLSKSERSGDYSSRGGKKRAETHVSGERMKYFADDDKYSLKEMFENEKYSNANDNEEQFAKLISKHKNPNDDLEDIFAENITKNISAAKSDAREKDKAIAQHKKIQKSLENCEYCVDSSKMLKHMIVSLGSSCYVALPTRKSLTEGHCIISTIMHTQCSTVVDEDSWSEIMDYRKALTNMFDSLDQDVVFFETAHYFNKHPHIVIHCVPIPKEDGDIVPIYFKKALLDCEAEWSNNKKVVDLRGKDIRRGVPKGLPYFWVDFGMSPGFAHVIEDQQLFPSNFAQEVIGGMMDLDHDLWRKPQRESFEAQKSKVLKFEKLWKPFDIVKK